MEEDSFKNRLLKRNIDIWIEKYRPEFLDEVVGNPFVINTLKSIITSGNMPNLLLAGAPGTGKTTSILCLASEMLGNQAKKAVSELNASDDRELIDDQVLKRILKICDLENIKYTDDGLDALTFIADGDLRKAVNCLQSTYAGLEVINKENVLHICDIPSPERIENLLKHCVNSEWKKAHDIAYSMIKEGHTPYDISLTSSNVLRRFNIGSEVYKLNFKIGAMACNTTPPG
ncbi:replication factor c subunit 4 [Plasmodium falciparum IGH-CR14]|uniref:Replication factor c subunit 4 n=1 Tax=Plasmodium falciparum IGH-CR14 TaxID=580059 RepID=A0A0L1IAH5_PLAFA|nr:replication factor c subunit 4 [Plasmodium falciparum IGH-CR14]